MGMNNINLLFIPIGPMNVAVNRNYRYHTQMALITGNQLRAARALAGVDQAWLAERSGVSVNTVRNMESRGSAAITSGAVTVRKVQAALEAVGIEFLNNGRPGVRLLEG